MSESEGLLERESNIERLSNRELRSSGEEYFSTKSEPIGSMGKKPRGGGFPRGLLSRLKTVRKIKYEHYCGALPRYGSCPKNKTHQE